MTPTPITRITSLPCLSSTRATPFDDGQWRDEQDLEVKPDGPPLDVIEVQIDHLLKGKLAAPAYLPQACQPGRHRQACVLAGAVQLDLVQQGWTWADKTHLALEHVEQLR